jgi:hypothetical protein
MAKKNLIAELTSWINDLSSLLHRDNAWGLAPLLWGMLFACGRRTIVCWLRVTQLGDHYQGYYYFLSSLGRNVKALAATHLRLAVSVICAGDRLLFAIDDTPTKRVRQARRGRRHSSQPDAGAGRAEVSLRPRLGHAGVVVRYAGYRL